MKDARGDGRCTSARRRACATASGATGRSRRPAGEIHRIRSVIDRVVDVEDTLTDSVVGGAAPRGEPDQALPAAVQRPAQGRQELPVHQGHARRRLPAHRADAQAGQRRQPLLRAVRVGVERRRVDEPGPPAVPVPDLHDRHQGRRAGPPAAVPAVPHQALPGPLHRGHLEGRLPGRHRAGRAVPRGPPGDARQGARHARWRRPPSGPSTSGRRPCATRSGRSSGRWRARRWPPSRGPSSTSLGLARQDNQAAIQLFVIRDGKMIGRDVFLLEAAARRARRRGPVQLPRAVLRAGRRRSRARSTCRRRSPRRADLEAFLAERRGGPVHLRVPQRGEKRELLALATRNAAETLAREQARWLADQGKTLGRARGAGRGARPARAAAPDRVLRHQQRPGQRVGRQHGRLRGRQAADRRVPPVQDPDGRRARTTSPATRRSCAAGSGPSRTGEEGGEEARRWAMPDLVIIDGGKGQVSAAKEVLDELGLHDLPLAGLAKEREELFLPGRAGPDRPAARRRRRCTSSSGCATRPTASRSPTTATCARRRSVRSAFDDLPGVGPKRKRALLRVFGSIKRVREAPVEQIAAVPGHRPVAGRPDQGDPRGLTRRLGSEFFIVRCTASLPLQRTLAERPARGLAPEEPRPCIPAITMPVERARASRPTARPLRRGCPCSCNIPPRCVKPAPSSSCSSASSPSSSTSARASQLPDSSSADGAGGRSRRSSGSTSRAACGSSTRRCPSRARRRRPADLAVIKDIIERRVNTTGVSEPVVTTQGTDRVVVELPGVTDPEAIRKLVGQTGRLDFVPLGSTQATEGQVARPEAVPAAVQRRPGRDGDGRHRPERPAASSTSSSRTTARSCSPTTPRSNVGEYFAIVLDNARHLGAGHPELDPRRQRPDHRRRARRLHAEGGHEARHGPPVRLAAVPDRGAVERARSARRSASSSSTRACSPALIGIAPRHHVHAHLLPAAGRRRELRAHLLHARRARDLPARSR